MKVLLTLLILSCPIKAAWSQSDVPPSLNSLIEKISLLPANSPATIIPTRHFEQNDCIDYREALRESYGGNKQFQNKCLLPSLVALSFYPELQDTKIRFVHRNTKTTLAARPRLFSLLRGRKKRTYTIYIDESVEKQQGVLLEEMSFNAQVGGLGHEYAHILDYRSRSGLNIMWLGIKYLLSKKAKSTLEKAVDKRTIERGLGWQVLAWEHYILHQSEASDQYKHYKQHVYLNPEEILFYIRSFPIYQHIE